MNSGIIVILFIIGLVAIVIEMLVPGVIMGVLGFLLCMISIGMAFHSGNTSLGWSLAITGVVLMPVLVILWFKMFTMFFAVNTSEQGYTASSEKDKELLGQEGVTLTKLRPAGMARFGDRRVDVMTDGEMIAKDIRVKAVKVEGNRVVVRTVKV